MTNCLNCGCSFTGNYCPECGQKAEVKRLSAAGLFTDILHFFTHFEKGFLHTSWNLLVRPGNVSLNFVYGKRKHYQSPVSYFFIWTGLYILLHNFVINHFGYHVSEAALSQMDLKEQANNLLRTHFTPFILPILFISAIVIYAVLAKPKFNLTEIFILCLYGGGTYFMMLFFSDLILGLIGHINIVSPGVFLWQTILSSVYNLWFCYDLFKKVKIRFLWLRLFTVAILIAALGLSLMIYLPLAWLTFF